MSELLDRLLELLDLEPIDRNIYRGANEAGRERLFGGQVAAQALVAAGRTIDGLPALSGLPAHSLHAYFLRPGNPLIPVLYTVDRIRDGRSFVTRRVVAIQNGQEIFTMAVSFHALEEGYRHQQPMPHAPAPEDVPTWDERMRDAVERIPEGMRGWAPRPRPLDLRYVDPPTYLGGAARDGPALLWLRAGSPLPDDRFLHQVLLTYASDMSLIDTAVRQHGRDGPLGPLMIASLDHALWFHSEVRVDDWLLYVQESPAAAGGRGFTRGQIFSRDGRLVASVAQEGLMRPVGSPEDRTQ